MTTTFATAAFRGSLQRCFVSVGLCPLPSVGSGTSFVVYRGKTRNGTFNAASSGKTRSSKLSNDEKMNIMCSKLDATSIGALIDGDDVMQRAGDDDGELGDATSDETIEDVADTDQSDEVDTEDVSDDEEYGVGWKAGSAFPVCLRMCTLHSLNL